MPTGPGNFVVQIPGKSGVPTAARVVEATVEDAAWWHAEVQMPFIETDAGTGKDQRIDKGWGWPRIVVRSAVFEAMTTGRSCAYLQLLCRRPDGIGVPVGQVLLVDAYPMLTERGKDSIFLWYLSGMPPTALKHFGLPADLKLLRALVDIAVQFSFLRQYQGRTCLHADRHGNRLARDDLAAKYSAIDLLRIGWSLRRMFVSPVRRNDGRYFVATESLALKSTAKLDVLR